MLSQDIKHGSNKENILTASTADLKSAYNLTLQKITYSMEQSIS
jgi:hypothetical protein